jgi:hypothetical protein
VPVEAAVAETCFAHQVGGAHALDSIAANPGGCGFHYPLVSAMLTLHPDRDNPRVVWHCARGRQEAPAGLVAKMVAAAYYEAATYRTGSFEREDRHDHGA